MSTNRVIAVIPARGGSKGIPGKNIRSVGGKPLIAHSIAHAQAVPGMAAVYVSTDDARIAQVASAYGAQVIERPAELANDTASSESALLHALDDLAARGEPEPDAVVFLQATSPRRRPDDVSRALTAFWEQQADSLFSATPAHGFMWRCNADGPKPMNYDPVHRPRRQDAPVDVIENGSIYIFKPSILRRYGSRLGGKIAVHTMRAEDSFQVDEPWELDLLDHLLRGDTRPPATTPSASKGGFEGATANNGPVLPSDVAYFSRREPRAQPSYEASYWGTVVDPDGKQRDRTVEREQHIADLAAELRFINSLPKGRIVDVGCGLGFLLSGVSDGWEKHGVEVSGFAAERAGQYGTIHHGDLASAKYPSDHFDVVVLHHVIEHVDEPLDLLREVLRIIKPDGRLVLGTPDFDGAMARRFGEKYRLLQDPTHVSLFTNESMHRALRDAGFVIDRVDYPFFETRHFNVENLQRLFETSQMSPAFYGSFMSFYCTKPRGADIRAPFVQLRRATDILISTLDEAIAAAAGTLGAAMARGHKVLAAGNGGSAADAQHFVAELVGRFKIERRALPAISLSSDPSVVTCLGNDYGYDQVFARQVRAFGLPGDVLIAITTSGKSPNILRAIEAARKSGMIVISLASERGSALKEISDHCIVIPSSDTPTIQELHMAVLHVLCSSIDKHVIG
jgi:CMP-N,N'-diacetyllegionaminic acid synthase